MIPENAPSVVTDADVDLSQLATELGEGVILSSVGLPHAHPITGVSEEATIYVDPAGVQVTQKALDAAVKAHRRAETN